MNGIVRLFFVIAGLSMVMAAKGQTVNGSWFGTGDVILEGTHNNYLVELNLKQDDNEVHGIIGYYFRDVYQSFYIRGKFDKKTRSLVILNIPMIYFRSNSTTSAECPMDLDATLITSVAQSTLKGSFRSQEKYKYTCPEIAFSYVLGTETKEKTSSETQQSAMKKIWKPLNEDLVVDVNQAAHPKKSGQTGTERNPSIADQSTKAQAVKNPAVLGPSSKSDTVKGGVVNGTKEQGNSDSNKTIGAVAVKPETVVKDNNLAAAPTKATVTDKAQGLAGTENKSEPKISKPVIPNGIPFEKRKDITMKEIEIESDSVRISLYDNGDIDGDIVSLYFNKIPLVSNQELNERGLNLYVTLDTAREVNDITMFAENLGRIPPNTALMVITDGVNRYEVFMSSSLTQNSTVRLRRKK